MNVETYSQIQSYVGKLLEMSGIEREEGFVGKLLFHAYVAVALYEFTTVEERAIINGIQKRMNYFFSSTMKLKERKRKKEKDIFPPIPLSIEKENKEKEEINTHTDVRETRCEFSGLDARRNDFAKKLWAHHDKYSRELLTSFYNYWSEENPESGRMRFEETRYFNIANRLSRWVKSSYTLSDQTASIRLKKAQKREQQVQTEASQQQAAAAEREQENVEREAKAEESRQTQMLTEDYIREHPDSLMAKIYRQKKNKE